MANITSGSVWVLDTAGTIAAAGQHITIRSARAVGLAMVGGAKLLNTNNVALWEDCSSQFGTTPVVGSTSAVYTGPLCKYRNPLTANGLVLQLFSCTGRVYVQVENVG